ncbi:MAG: 30S ribosomal protein S6 [Bacillati bacterium ANGP1]|uniref:Small ribosomal subunit protein bS6 n=1 Tax=Candidatus Segetimicrobium genomatis TaxID=2569760 RepID=A0A537LCE2_9BACT|nr:MAG: 30S ribosomal protein S6 [Terrabacteria group bacterium ANGP1]
MTPIFTAPEDCRGPPCPAVPVFDPLFPRPAVWCYNRLARGAPRGILFRWLWRRPLKSYDLVYIVRPDLEPDAIKAVVERVTQRVQDQGAKVEAVDVWGRRRMSFAIGKHREGVYVHTRLTVDPQKTAEIRRLAAVNEEVLRAVTTRAVGKLPEPAAPAAPPVPSAPSGGPSQPAEA